MSEEKEQDVKIYIPRSSSESSSQDHSLPAQSEQRP